MTATLFTGVALACALAVPAPLETAKSGWRRWIDPQAITVSSRYRSIETSGGVRSANQLQYASLIRGRLTIDRGAKLTLNAQYATGNNFIGSWNNTGIGSGDFAGTWALKHLHAGWAPADGIEVTYGSLGLARGTATEITTYDNDGYLSGERISVRRPRHFFVDELTASRGYLGDLATASVFDRFDRITGGRNYYQILASKTARTVTMSADYTRLSGVPYVRLAAVLKTPGLGVLDTVRVETYARFGRDDARGFSVSGEKAIGTRLSAGAGYADIDPRYPLINGDRYARGKRVYGTASVKLTPELVAQLFATAAVHKGFPIPNARRVDAVLVYNLLGRLERAGWLK